MTVDIEVGGEYLLTDAATTGPIEVGGEYLLTDAATTGPVEVGGVYLLVDINMLAATPLEVGAIYLLVDVELDDISADGTASSSGVAALSGRDWFMNLTITDGTTTANLVDGINYDLVDRGWAPGVAALRLSTLGGYGPYENVIEEITVNIYGATGAACLANLAQLSRLLDRAERWSRGEQVDPVRLTCQPNGSTLENPLESVIIGRANQQPLMGLPVTFNDQFKIDIFEIPAVRLRFVRRGLWLAAGETPAASSAVANPGIMTVTFGDTALIASPTDVQVTVGLSSTAALNQFLLIADAAERIQIVEAEDLVFGSSIQWTSITDAPNYASDGSVAHYIPTDLLYKDLLTSTPSGVISLPTTARRIALFAALRNNSASASFSVRPVIYGIVDTYSPPETYIDTSSTKPRLVYLGTISLAEQPLMIGIQVAASTITGPPTLDIDYVCLLDMTDDCARVISLPGVTADMALMIETRVLTDPAPIAYHQQVLGSAPASYMGDAYIVTRGAELAVAWLALSPTTTNWVYVSGGAAKTTTLSSTRYTAYLTPE